MQVDLSKQILASIEHGDFVVHYQPKVDLISGRIVGAEALARWQHPALGMLPPSRFLTLAEQYGSIVVLGKWIRNAVAQFAGRVNANRHAALQFAVNASVLELTDPAFVSSTARALALHRCNPSWLTVEITESVRADDATPSLLATLRGLRAMGLGISLDDFGTGYSCLARLLDWPLSELKIDRAFIWDIEASTAKQAVVRQTICIADQLGLSVVAEGIETHAQRSLIAQLGCPQGQGYLFGRPQDEATFCGLLAHGGLLAPTLRPTLLNRSA